MSDRTPSTRPTRWLVATLALGVIGIAVLWPLQNAGRVCTLVYPAPPGCDAQEPRWVPLVAVGLVIALLTAAVVAYTLAPTPRTVLLVVAAVIVVIVAIAAIVVGLSQTGIWDPYQPPVLVD